MMSQRSEMNCHVCRRSSWRFGNSSNQPIDEPQEVPRHKTMSMRNSFYIITKDESIMLTVLILENQTWPPSSIMQAMLSVSQAAVIPAPSYKKHS